MRLRHLTLGLLLVVAAFAQPVQNVAVQPECQIFLSATAIATSVSYDNRSKACDRWIVTYSSYTFAGPLSLQVESSADNAGAPAAWVAFAGTIVSGVNPNVATTQALTSLSGFYPWMRLNLTATGAGAGKLTATLYGYKDRPASVTIGGVISTNLSQYGGVAVGAGNALHVQPGTAAYFPPSAAAAIGDGLATNSSSLATAPLVSMPLVYDPIAGTWSRVRGTANGLLYAGLGSGATGGVIASKAVCDLYAPITLAAAIGYTEVVALTAARQIRVCNISVGFAGVETPSLAYGTGANCGTGTTAITGAYPNILALALDFADPLRVPASRALCVRQTGGAGGGGMVNYAIY